MVITARSFWLWFGGIWLVAGLPIAIAGAVSGLQHRQLTARLDADGQTVDGLVLTKAITRSSSGSSRDAGTPTYEVTFRFATPGGPVTGGADVTRDTWDALVEREPIRVTYLPDAPRHHRVDGQTGAWIASVLMVAGGGAFAGVGGVILVTAAARRRRDARLQQMGTTTEATVVELQPATLIVNGERQWSLRYQYTDALGHLRTGTQALSPHDAEAWTEGDIGLIRYDPHRPDDSLWIGTP